MAALKMKMDTNQSFSGLAIIFGLLMLVTLGGIAYHQLSGFDYPASAASAYELNVLGDLFEALILVPAGLIGLWAMLRGRAWGTLVVAGVAANLTYNYAMALTGRQNLWVFFWIVKFVLAGTTICLLWRVLPAGTALPARSRWAIVGYLLIVGLVFSKMMGERLLASAAGRLVTMTMEDSGPLDWGDPVVRDPVIFFSFTMPLVIAGILGLIRRLDWGGRAAAIICAFVVNIVSLVLFTGPLQEALRTGAVSPAMMTTSVIMVLAAAPAILFLNWMSKDGSGSPARAAAVRSEVAS